MRARLAGAVRCSTPHTHAAPMDTVYGFLWLLVFDPVYDTTITRAAPGVVGGAFICLSPRLNCCLPVSCHVPSVDVPGIYNSPGIWCVVSYAQP